MTQNFHHTLVNSTILRKNDIEGSSSTQILERDYVRVKNAADVFNAWRMKTQVQQVTQAACRQVHAYQLLNADDQLVHEY